MVSEGRRLQRKQQPTREHQKRSSYRVRKAHGWSTRNHFLLLLLHHLPKISNRITILRRRRRRSTRKRKSEMHQHRHTDTRAHTRPDCINHTRRLKEATAHWWERYSAPVTSLGIYLGIRLSHSSKKQNKLAHSKWSHRYDVKSIMIFTLLSLAQQQREHSGRSSPEYLILIKRTDFSQNVVC